MKKSAGAIALTTVILISSILLIGGIAVVLSTMDLTISTRNFQAQQSLAGTERTCLEEALMKISNNHAFEGTVSYTNNATSCTAVVSTDDQIPSLKHAQITSIRGEFTKIRAYKIDTSTSPIAIVK